MTKKKNITVAEPEEVTIVDSGTQFAMDSLATLAACEERIHNNLQRAEYSLFDVARDLALISDQGFFKEVGFKNMAEYANARFGIKKAQTYNMIGIAHRFLPYDVEGSTLATESGDFGATQLIKLLPLPEGTAEELVEKGVITPDMTASEIKKTVDSILKPTEEVTETTEEVTETTEEVTETTEEATAITPIKQIEAYVEEAVTRIELATTLAVQIMADDSDCELVGELDGVAEMLERVKRIIDSRK